MKKIFVVLGVLMVILVAAQIFLSNSPAPVAEKISEEGSEIDPNLQLFKNEYISFVYPKVFTLENIPTTDGRVYANVKITSPDGVSSRFLLIERAMSQDLEELDDIKIRRADSLQYSEEIARVNDLRGFLFRTADKKERTVYFKKDGRLLVVTLTSASPFDEAEREFQDFLSTVSW